MSKIIKIAISKTLESHAIEIDWNDPSRIKNAKQWIRECIAKKILESDEELITFFINEEEKTIEGGLSVEITEAQVAKIKSNNPKFF